MVTLNSALSVWEQDDFSSTLKAEIERLRSDVLPISHVIGEGNLLYEDDLGAIVNEISDDEDYIYAKVGIFFSEIINCSTCSGGNGMVDEAYCELQVSIDKNSAEAHFKPIG